jgi:hypothetical protein
LFGYAIREFANDGVCENADCSKVHDGTHAKSWTAFGVSTALVLTGACVIVAGRLDQGTSLQAGLGSIRLTGRF